MVCFAGDGDFLMNGQEFATAVQYELPFIIVIVDNGTVRHHPHASGARISRPRGRDRTEAIRISPPMRARSAASASRWRRPPISPRRSRRRKNPASPRSSISRSTPNALTPAMTLEAIRAKALAGQGRVAARSHARRRRPHGSIAKRAFGLRLVGESRFSLCDGLSPHRQRGPQAGTPATTPSWMRRGRRRPRAG